MISDPHARSGIKKVLVGRLTFKIQNEAITELLSLFIARMEDVEYEAHGIDGFRDYLPSFHQALQVSHGPSSLTFRCWTDPVADNVEWLLNHRRLRSLTLCWYKNEGGLGLFLGGLARLPSLNRLEIECIHDFHWNNLMRAVESHPSLEDVNVGVDEHRAERSWDELCLSLARAIRANGGFIKAGNRENCFPPDLWNKHVVPALEYNFHRLLSNIAEIPKMQNDKKRTWALTKCLRRFIGKPWLVHLLVKSNPEEAAAILAPKVSATPTRLGKRSRDAIEEDHSGKK